MMREGEGKYKNMKGGISGYVWRVGVPSIYAIAPDPIKYPLNAVHSKMVRGMVLLSAEKLQKILYFVQFVSSIHSFGHLLLCLAI
jgi:hypothetical protein